MHLEAVGRARQVQRGEVLPGAAVGKVQAVGRRAVAAGVDAVPVVGQRDLDRLWRVALPGVVEADHGQRLAQHLHLACCMRRGCLR